MLEKSLLRLKKVIWWRIFSIILTMVILYIIQQDIKQATYATIFLQIIHVIAHWFFEYVWDERILRKPKLL